MKHPSELTFDEVCPYQWLNVQEAGAERVRKIYEDWNRKEYERMSEETRVTDPTTGGEKGSKLCRLDLIPAGPLMELGEHFGKGCKKYAARNWERGYAWSLSFAAAQRHLWQFWNGEDVDPETKSKHVIAAAWHCLAMAEFMRTHPEKDDRVNSPQSASVPDDLQLGWRSRTVPCGQIDHATINAYIADRPILGVDKHPSF